MGSKEPGIKSQESRQGKATSSDLRLELNIEVLGVRNQEPRIRTVLLNPASSFSEKVPYLDSWLLTLGSNLSVLSPDS